MSLSNYLLIARLSTFFSLKFFLFHEFPILNIAVWCSNTKFACLFSLFPRWFMAKFNQLFVWLLHFMHVAFFIGAIIFISLFNKIYFHFQLPSFAIAILYFFLSLHFVHSVRSCLISLRSLLHWTRWSVDDRINNNPFYMFIYDFLMNCTRFAR